MASRALLQRHAEFNRFLYKAFLNVIPFRIIDFELHALTMVHFLSEFFNKSKED